MGGEAGGTWNPGLGGRCAGATSWSEPAGSCSTVLLPPARDPSASDATMKLPVGRASLKAASISLRVICCVTEGALCLEGSLTAERPMFEIIPSWSEPAGSCSTVLLPPARDPSASDATVKPVGQAGLVCPEDNPGGTCAAGLAGAGSCGSKGKPPGSGTTGEGWGGETGGWRGRTIVP